MRIMIAGLGSIGRRHLRNLLALGERDLLLYRSHRSTLPDSDLQGFPVETDLRAALTWGPQAVIVANPTALHLEVAIPAAQAGCHLLLEKPVSHSTDGLSELHQALEQGGGRALVGFQFRFHPGLEQAARCLAEGAIGRPLSARAVYAEYLPGMHPWEDYRMGYGARSDLGGGVVFTLCHPLDTLGWLLGEVEAVWAFTGQLNDLVLDVEDTAEIGLRFARGALGSVHLDYNRRPPDHHLEIIGSGGTLRWDNSSGILEVHRAEAGDRQIYPPPAGFERNVMFLEEMRHFLAVARGEAEPRCSLQDGRRALELALAAHRSQQTGSLVYLS
ncbi:MAG TPA: Gfo/Idh/MocA family oxidoreductase [Anaerolineales bacterium]|nr:Gfo/Idh/MocA family oxidoreductase [Anaerolineales bacterium]